ncbi:MAG: hypothetical protein RLZZ136_409 [Pseudomonadota bacterium]|jgi:hypothetical protein
MRAHTLLGLSLIALLSACGEGGPQMAAQVVSAPSPVSKPVALVGLEGVIGASSADLIRQFGAPRLDVWEGDSRKLQFAGPLCVMDVYLYPPNPGRAPLAGYLDARRLSDGRDMDRAACVAALRITP